MLRYIKKIVRDSQGTTALEFALVSPIVILLIVGTMEFAMIGFRTTILEGGLREAARFGTTGASMTGTANREEAIINIVNDHANGLFTVTASDLSTLVYPDFSQIGESETYTDADASGDWNAPEEYTDVNCNGQYDEDMGLTGAGGGSEVVLYTVSMEVDSLTGLIDHLITDDGKIPLSATIAIRNEPFPGGTTVCPGP